MAQTSKFYGGNTMGAGRTMQDFGLCNAAGEYVYTARLRTKGLLVIVFFSPTSPPSARALQAVQTWTTNMPTDKWTVIGVADMEREDLTAFGQAQGLSSVTLVMDHELYQTRNWGVSHLPSLYLVSGKTGRVLGKVMGDDAGELDAIKQLLTGEIEKIVAAENAAKAAAAKAEEEKKAAEAAKPPEPAAKA